MSVTNSKTTITEAEAERRRRAVDKARHSSEMEGGRSSEAHLAEQAVVVVTQADSKAPPADVARVADGYRAIAREAVTVPFDPAMVDGLLRYGSLRPGTQRAWLAAAAAVARGL